MLIFPPKSLRPLNIALLSMLRTAGEQNDERLTIFAKVNSIPGTKIEPEFKDPADAFCRRKIPGFNPFQ